MPSYYILLNVLVVVGSLFLRGEWGDKVGMVSALCGMYTIFCAIYLLQVSVRDCRDWSEACVASIGVGMYNTYTGVCDVQWH